MNGIRERKGFKELKNSIQFLIREATMLMFKSEKRGQEKCNQYSSRYTLNAFHKMINIHCVG